MGGHSYLITTFLQHWRNQPQDNVKALLELAPTEAGPYAQHLQDLLTHLQTHAELATAMKLVTQASEPIRVKAEEGFMLHSLGLVHLRGNEVEVRCRLYQQYFSDRLADL